LHRRGGQPAHAHTARKRMMILDEGLKERLEALPKIGKEAAIEDQA
jgi:hypothetical protein